MAEAPSYNSLEGKLDVAGSYLLQTGDAELRKYGPKLIKAKHMILDSSGVAQYMAGVDVIGTLETIMVADKLYGEAAAVKIAAEASYNFKPLMDILADNAAELGNEKGKVKLHEIYEKLMKKDDSELHRLVSELAPYDEIMKSAEKSNKATSKGAARKVREFMGKMNYAKRNTSRKVSLYMTPPSYALIGGLGAGVSVAVNMLPLQLGNEISTRFFDYLKLIDGRLAKGINAVDGQLNRAGLSLSYLGVLGIDLAIGMPIDLGTVLLWTYGMPAVMVADKKSKPYFRKAKAAIRTLRKGYENGKFWEKVKEDELEIEAEEQLEKGPSGTKRGWWREQLRHLNMTKIPIGKKMYVDPFALRIGKRLEEKKILESAGREFKEELASRYSPAVCNALLGEYLPNVKVSEEELIKARGASRTVMGTTITESSKSARKFGTGKYTFSPSYCEQVAAIRAGVLEKEGYDCVTGENGDVVAFHKSASGQKNLKEAVLVHEKDRLFGTSVKYLEDAVRGGGIVQFPKLGKNGIENWDLQDYKVYVSDLLEEEMAVPVLYHELTAHVGNRLEAFETLMQLGDAIVRQQEKAAVSKQSGVKAEGMFK